MLNQSFLFDLPGISSHMTIWLSLFYFLCHSPSRMIPFVLQKPTTRSNTVYYTSREDTFMLLDESHVSKLLATFVSVRSLTAVTIRRTSTRCQGAVNCKPTDS